MLAVIKTGGKQYIVSPGEKIRTSPSARTLKASPILKIEKIDKKEGSEIAFNEVLLLEKGKHLEIGTPLVKGAKVMAKVLSQGKAKKVIIFKYKAKKRYKVKKGHRQPFTEVEIKSIDYTP